MSKKVWVRCLIISLTVSLLVPLFTMTIMVPAEGEEVVDLRSIELDELSRLSEERAGEYLDSRPMRQVHGFERITYLITDPSWLAAYWRAIVVWFVSFLAATSLVSFLNNRDVRDA